MKRIITGILAAALLFSIGSVLAGNAGSSSDPLISKSYINDTYKTGLLSDGKALAEARLEAVYAAALSKLEISYNGYKTVLGSSDYKLASAQEQYLVPAGDYVRGITGTSVTLLSGGMTVNIVKGAVINVATGEEVPSGTKLTAGMRYFCAEDTEAVFNASELSDVTVNGQYKTSSGAEKTFTVYADVSPEDWYYEGAVFVYENGLFHDARTKDTFRQAEKATRATLFYTLWKLSGAPDSDMELTFEDMTETWYVPAVRWCVENKLVEGYSDTQFGPNDNITREQIATLLYRYAKFMGGDLSSNADLSGYTDAGQIGDWALEGMKWANRHGFITGVTNTTLVPKGLISRAEVAVLVTRYAD